MSAQRQQIHFTRENGPHWLNPANLGSLSNLGGSLRHHAGTLAPEGDYGDDAAAEETTK